MNLWKKFTNWIKYKAENKAFADSTQEVITSMRQLKEEGEILTSQKIFCRVNRNRYREGYFGKDLMSEGEFRTILNRIKSKKGLLCK